VLSSLSPCFFPLFPPFLAYVAHVEKDARKGVLAGVTCTLGIALSLIFYGSLISILAIPLLKYGELLRYGFGIIIIIMGLAISTRMGIAFRWIRYPKRLLRVQGMLGTFILGLSYALITAPCSLPIFVSGMLLATVSGNIIGTVANTLCFAIGAGLPFILSALLIASVKNKINQYYERVIGLFNSFSGLILILVGILLLLPAFGLPTIL
jgi:cytochrome c-type biogenesis protein